MLLIKDESVMPLVYYLSTKRDEQSVSVLPGAHVRVQWLHENGAIEYERTYRRPEPHVLVEIADYERVIQDLRALLAEEQRENAALRSRLKPDAAYF